MPYISQGYDFPSQMEDKVEVFQQQIIQVHKKDDFDLSQIRNMDGTPASFDLLSNYTGDRKRSQSCICDNYQTWKIPFHGILCWLAESTRLPPIMICRRKTLTKYSKFLSGVIVRAYEKVWMDEYIIFDWLEKIWNQQNGTVFNKSSLLVQDFLITSY